MVFNKRPGTAKTVPGLILYHLFTAMQGDELITHNLEETDKLPKLRPIIYRKGLISKSFFFIFTYLRSNLQRIQKHYL